MWEELESRLGLNFSEPAEENFQQEFTCFSLSCAGREDLEHGNKILLPQSTLNFLARINVNWPIFFKLTNKLNGRNTHCGVLEFSSEEGICFIPYWVMQNLRLDEGDIIHVCNVSLPKGTFVKLQPMTQEFLLLEDPRATLETSLSRFASITVGDIISIEHNNKTYKIDIIECMPDKAISLIETDVEVDFDPPKDYVPPPPVQPASANQDSQSTLTHEDTAQSLTNQPKVPIPGGVRTSCEKYEELVRQGKVQGKLKNIEVYLPHAERKLFEGQGHTLKH